MFRAHQVAVRSWGLTGIPAATAGCRSGTPNVWLDKSAVVTRMPAAWHRSAGNGEGWAVAPRGSHLTGNGKALRAGSRPSEGMDMMKTPSDAIRDSLVRLTPGRYAVLRCADVPDGSGWFMITRDPDGVTVIVEESAIPESRALETDGGYRLVEIKVATGFESAGFLATATRALAEAGLSILVVSTYSKDYVPMSSRLGSASR